MKFSKLLFAICVMFVEQWARIWISMMAIVYYGMTFGTDGFWYFSTYIVLIWAMIPPLARFRNWGKNQ